MHRLLQTDKSLISMAMDRICYLSDHFDDASVYINDASNSDDVALYVVDEGKFYEGSVSASNEVTWSAATRKVANGSSKLY